MQSLIPGMNLMDEILVRFSLMDDMPSTISF